MQINKEAKIGVTVLIVLAAFIWGLNFLKGRNIFSSTNDYFLVFDNVGGLMESNNVLLSGYKVGLVTDIHMKDDHSGKIIVVITIDDNVKIPSGSKAVLFNSDIMGTKSIKLEFSNLQSFYQDGDTLQSEVELGLMDQFMPMKDKVENLITSIDSLVDNTSSILDDSTRMYFQRSIANVESVTASVGDQQKKLDRILGNVESISGNIEANNQVISNIIENFSSISDSLARIEIASTMLKIDKTLGATNEIMKKIENGEGSIGMLINNDTLYNNLDDATKSLDLLLKDLKENPKRYVHFSVFGRKNRNP
ncbi:MAG: MlaD family protein [Bacteroidota bacterium]